LRKLRDQGRTILITTHYMDEAERLCDRVAVVDHAKVIALGTPAQLIAKIGGEHLTEFSVENGAPLAEPELMGLPAVVHVRCEDEIICSLAVTAPHLTLPALMEYRRAQNRSLVHLATRHASLEDVFVTLTGRRLRDDG
jgi:ABC-2 type transport system ATP-binding protein